jgi:DNA-directed RNA polymerase subunit RPC12/RpoP
MIAQSASPSTSRPGVPCPECSFVIPTTFEMLLSGEPIVCPMCGLALQVDRETSAGSLELISNLHEATQQVEETKQQWR